MKKKNPVRGNNGRFAIKKKSTQKYKRGSGFVNLDYFNNEAPEDCRIKINRMVNPVHYTSHPSGVQCIQISRHMTANLAAALQYIWGSALKQGAYDLEKAIWYLADEIDRVRGESDKPDAFGEYIKQSIASYYAVKNNGNG